jgi:hypothetical protein
MSIVISEQAQAIFDKIQAMRESTTVPAPQVSAVTDVQLEAWKKMPKEQAVKELLHFLEIKKPAIQDDRDTYLSGLKLLAEITGAITPMQSANQQNIVAIKISVADLPPGMKIIKTVPNI